jgi:hypothetical protein
MKQPTGKTLEKMTRDATVVGRAHVEKVETVNGIRVARVRIVEAFKGCQDGQRLTYLAEPVWRCDISDAIRGETTLLMLTAAPKNPFDREGWEDKRKQFEKARRGGLRSEPLWMLFHSGNGRMLIETYARLSEIQNWIRRYRAR